MNDARHTPPNAVVLAVCLFAAAPFDVALAGNPTPQLQPERGLFGFGLHDPYKLAVGRALLEEHQYRYCQAVFIPSFETESAVYILRPEASGIETPRVVSVEITHSLWGQLMQFLEDEAEGSGYSVRFEDQQRALRRIRISVDRREAPIDTEAVDTLENAWDAMLQGAHYPAEPRMGLDGVNYHFANFKRGYGYWAGRVWSPPDGSPTHELVEIAELLRAYPRLPVGERDGARALLVHAARILLSRLRHAEE